MSWQCPYCETVNQDAVPICTVCERVAPVVESFLSLEQIDHAREYEELLSEIYSFEAEQDYDKMLQAALKAASTFTQNDTAISKVHLAIKLAYEKKSKSYILSKIVQYTECNNYTLANTYVSLWQNLKFDNTLILSYIETINAGLNIASHKDQILRQVTNNILDGAFSEALTIIETELLTYKDATELLDLRSKVQNLIKNVEHKEKIRKTPKPLRKSLEPVDSLVDVTPPKSVTTSTKRKFPKVKRK